MNASGLKNSTPFVLVCISCCLIMVTLLVLLLGFDPGTTLTPGHRLWALYILIGMLVPVTALVATRSTTSDRVKFTLAAIGTYLILIFVLQTRHYGALSLGVIETALAWPLVRRTWQDDAHRGWVAWTLAVVLSGSWAAVAALPWATPLEAILTGRSTYTVGFTAAIALVIATVWGTLTLTSAATSGPRPWLRAVDAAALILFAIAGFRTDFNFYFDDQHVSFFMGPVEAIRQGGWLLWDVPSQYGVGNMWLAAHVPAHTSYGAFVYLNCMVAFLAAAISYAVARTWAKTPLLAAFCACAILATNFLLAGWYLNSTAFERYPSIGAIRFIWCYALIGLVALAYVRGWIASSSRAVLGVGNLCWVLAACWSFDAAIFATIVWFPTSAAIALRDRPLKNALYSWLWAVLGLTGIAVIVLGAFLIHFHHGPDWYAYLEYALIYQAGFGSLPLNVEGSVWVLVAAFAAVISVGAYVWHERRLEALPVVIAAASLQWASASYFIVRSHDNNVNNLMPLMLIALFATMAVIANEKFTGLLPAAFKLLLVPFLALPLGLVSGAATLDTQSLTANGWLAGKPGRWGALAKPIAPALMKLLQRNGLTPLSPILYTEPALYTPPHWPGSDAMPALWLPDHSRQLLGILPQARQEQYFRRWAADGHPTTAYLVIDSPADPRYADTAPFFAALNDIFTAVDVDHEGPYYLKRYSLKP